MPKEQNEPEKKKATDPGWKPFRRMDVANKDPNYRYRWALRDAANLEQKLNEGWVTVDGASGIKGHASFPTVGLDGKTVDSTAQYREHILMAIPKDKAEARDKYYEELTDKRTRGLKRDAEALVAGDAPQGRSAPVHGTIVIS